MDCAGRGCGTPCSPGPATRRCGNCGAVAYCSRSHQMLHWSEHKEECSRLEQQMRRADVLNDFPFSFARESTALLSCLEETRCSFLTSIGVHNTGLWSTECSCGPSVDAFNNSGTKGDWSLPSSLCPCTEPGSLTSTCLSSWKDYYQWRCLPFDSPASVLLHWPLTIYHCLQLSSVQTLNSDGCNKLYIHYLGPDKELSQLAVFGELQALFSGIQLFIELVGPAVPQSRDGEETILDSYLQCLGDNCPCKTLSTKFRARGCSGRTSTVTLKLRKGFYHDRFIDIQQDSYPQLIVAPNAGIAAYSTWLPTIELIKGLGIPVIFTDFCEEAAYLAAQCISGMIGRPLRIPIQINPFRQPIVMEDTALYLPCYSNGFLFGI